MKETLVTHLLWIMVDPRMVGVSLKHNAAHDFETSFLLAHDYTLQRSLYKIGNLIHTYTEFIDPRLPSLDMQLTM